MTSKPDTRNQVPQQVSVTATGAEPHLPPRQNPRHEKASLFSKGKRLCWGCEDKQKHTHTSPPPKNAPTRDISTDNTVLDILTKMCTEINPQRNVLNYISRHKSPEYFKQAPKFGDLGTGIIKTCSRLPWCSNYEWLNRKKKYIYTLFLCLRLGTNPSCLLLAVCP